MKVVSSVTLKPVTLADYELAAAGKLPGMRAETAAQAAAAMARCRGGLGTPVSAQR